MKNLRKIHLGLLLLVLSATTGFASHVNGGDITYSCVNSCTVRVQMRVYRDCSGVSIIDPTGMVWRGGPGCIAPTPVGGWSPQLVTEIITVCPGASTLCTNPNAVINGVQEYSWYRDYDICSVAPCEYNLVYSTCCRNPSITSLVAPANNGIYLGSTTINTNITPCNSSPQFISPPVIYLAQGQTTVTSLACLDVEGDSLAYELGPCLQDSGLSTTYQPGYSATAPLGTSWNVTLDTHTGQLAFAPNPGNVVVGIVCVYVHEYRNGQRIGTILRDYLVVVAPVPNNTLPTMGSLTNFTGAATVAGNVITMCNPTPICFDILSADANAGQNMAMSWSQNLPGATFTQIGNPSVQDTIYGTGALPPGGRFCWTPPGYGNFTVSFGVADDACPLLGTAQQSVVIRVGQGDPLATATLGSCPTVQFSTAGCGLGAWTYAWSGTGGLSSTLQNPSHTYPAPGNYPWQVIMTNGIVSDTVRDTVVVPSGPFYQPILNTGIVLLPCFGTVYDTLFGGSYASYMWSTGATSSNLVVSMAGNYGLTVTDVYGCQYHDSTLVQSLSPDIEGHVTTSTSAPLQNQKIYLILHDSINQALYALDSIQTDSSGYYFFCNVTDTLVFLKAAPDSADYPTEMPTYADASLFWSSATTFRPLIQSPFVHDFSTMFGANPGGPGFIGGLISQGANKMNAIGDPVPGLRVFLRDQATGDVLAYRETDANGYFSFANIPLGTYEIVPDKYLVSTVNVPVIALTAQTPVMDSLDFQLHSTWLELVAPTVGIGGKDLAFGVQVVPNPFSQVSSLKMQMPEAGRVQVQVYDVLGRIVVSEPALDLSQGKHTLHFGNDLEPGIYFVRVESLGKVLTMKVVKE